MAPNNYSGCDFIFQVHLFYDEYTNQVAHTSTNVIIQLTSANLSQLSEGCQL